jgi:hypothetical protein
MGRWRQKTNETIHQKSIRQTKGIMKIMPFVFSVLKPIY